MRNAFLITLSFLIMLSGLTSCNRESCPVYGSNYSPKKHRSQTIVAFDKGRKKRPRHIFTYVPSLKVQAALTKVTL